MAPDNANGRLRRGQLLADRYRVEELIGRGGMAEVYRGHDERLARPVALKVLRNNLALDPNLRTRFEDEARAAAIISHPNIVAVYDAGEDDAKAFIVMELVTGETLFDRINRGPLSSEEVRSIGLQVLAALGEAHARGVLHRDVKPANVLITEDGQAKVADFGIAKAVDPSPDSPELTGMNVVLGTPSYLAPERAQGQAATASSDLWSVGVVMYEALTGARPFEGENPVAITLAAQQGNHIPVLERRPDVDPGLAAVVERAILADPAARYASAGEMAAALERPDVAATQLLGAGGDIQTTRAIAPATSVLGTSPAEGAALGAVAGVGAGEGTTSFVREEEALATPPRRSRAGTAVLAGAAVALLLGGIVAAVLLIPSAAHPKSHHHHHHHHKSHPTTTTRPKKKSTTTLPTTSSTSSTTSSTVAPTTASSTSSTSTTTTSSTTSTTSSTVATTSSSSSTSLPGATRSSAGS